jgi:hypothetical protein
MDPVRPSESKKRSVGFSAPVPIPITKYLWDDPGDPKGIATIRIDSLPTKSGGVIEWKDAKIKDIKAELINDNKGLSVTVTTDDDTVYRLLLPRLYGSVDAVKEVSKEKRLLVRVFKSLGGEKATEAWPHPYRKDA